METTKTIYTYQWKYDAIRSECKVFGLDSNNKTCLLRAVRYEPYFYIECGSIEPNILIKSLKDIMSNITNSRDQISIETIQLRKLYGYNDYEPFIKCKAHRNAKMSFFTLKKLSKYLRDNEIPVNEVPTKIKIHEDKISTELQLISQLQVPYIGWISVLCKTSNDYVSTCDYEFTCFWKNIEINDEISSVPTPLVISFDIEAYNSDTTQMPNPKKPNDVIMCISTAASDGEKKIFIATDHVNDIEGAEVVRSTSEKNNLINYINYIKKKRPNVIIGYNIFGFDTPYLIKRSEFLNIKPLFMKMGFIINEDGFITTKRSETSAYGVEIFEFVNYAGIVFLDLYPIIKRNYRFDNYKLNTVSEIFINESKLDISIGELNSSYKDQDKELLTKMSEYCLQDSLLVLKLFNHLNTWIGSCEMAKTCNVQINDLYVNGQQHRVFSQIYKYTSSHEFVVDASNAPKPKMTYQGAFVVDPQPGMYNNIIPFDFNSLYPTSIIAYNIDYTTYIDEKDYEPGDNIVEWDDYKFYFKSAEKRQGIIPYLLTNLISARKKVNGRIKDLKESMKTLGSTEEIKNEINILDKRQWSYKISANSMYGVMGVQSGRLPFMVGAMCTTAIGRISIKKAIDFMRDKYNADIIYGDTDSVMVSLKESDPLKMWKMASEIEKEISVLFKSPMRLAFEDKIYSQFLIFSKKKYLTMIKYVSDGVVRDGGLYSRGILLVRRDCCKFVRKLYKETVDSIFSGVKITKCMNNILENLLKVLRGEVPIEDFILTKTYKNRNSYAKKTLPEDPVSRDKRLRDLQCSNEDEFREKTLPGIVQLTAKIQSRGIVVNEGERIEYVVVSDLVDKPLYLRMEHFDYFKENRDTVKLDKLYYIESALNPLDQLISTVFSKHCTVSKMLTKKPVTMMVKNVIIPHVTELMPEIKSKVVYIQ